MPETKKDKNMEEKREEIPEKEHVKDTRDYARQYLKEMKRREEERGEKGEKERKKGEEEEKKKREEEEIKRREGEEKKKREEEEIKRREEEEIKEKEKVKEKPKREITKEEPTPLNIEDITLPRIEEIANDENAAKPEEKEEGIKLGENKLKGEKKGVKGEQISGVKVEKTKAGNIVSINVKAIRDIENCVVEDSVPLKEVDIEVEGAEKIEEKDKTVIRWHAGRIEKGSEITLKYKVYKKTRGGVRYGINLTKEKLPPVKVTWEEKSEVERRIEKVVDEKKRIEEGKIREKEGVKEKPKREITEEPKLLDIEDITLPAAEEIAHEGKAAEPEEKEKKKELIEEKPEKKLEEIETPEMDKLINIAMIIAIIIGIGVTAALIYYTGQESYSDLYIYPDSYSNYVEGDTVSFKYGVRSFETQETRYELNVFLGEQLVKQKEFRLEKGGKLEETININVPDNTEFPVKVRIVVRMNDRENSVHFWLKGRK